MGHRHLTAYVTLGFSVIVNIWIELSASGGSTSTTECECRWRATEHEGFNNSLSNISNDWSREGDVPENKVSLIKH